MAANHLRDPTSFTFLDRLHAELAALPIAAELRDALVRLWWLRRLRPRDGGPAVGAGHVAHLVQRVYCSKLDDGWAKWYLAVAAILRGVVRASSLVECMNSVLRMHPSRHRTITPGMLDLKRLCWNTRCFGGVRRKRQMPLRASGTEAAHVRLLDPPEGRLRRGPGRSQSPSRQESPRSLHREGRRRLTVKIVKLLVCDLGRCQERRPALPSAVVGYVFASHTGFLVPRAGLPHRN